jgi:hypothetical protein
MGKRILKLLYRSFDTELRPREKKRLDRALKKSEELRRSREETSSLRRAVMNGAVRAFRPGFSDRVMARLQVSPQAGNHLESLSRAFQAVFRRFAFVALLILAVLVTYNLIHLRDISAGDVYYISDVSFGRILPLPLF